MKCAVNGCKSSSYNLQVHGLSLHKLPNNAVMREAWLRKLGKTYLSPHARVCSAHFSKESFLQSRRKKIKRTVSTRKSPKLLLPNAVPTLMLTTVTPPRNMPAVTPDIMASSSDVNQCSGTGQSDIENPCGIVSPAACNMNVSAVNVETPKRYSQRLKSYPSPHPPPTNTRDIFDMKCSATVPRRSERLQRICRIPSNKHERKGLSKIKSRKTLERGMDYRSSESTPLRIRRERYFNENCVGTQENISQKGLEKDLQSEVKLLSEQIQHYRSIADFHIHQAVCRATSTQTSVQAENDDLKLQLQHTNTEMERMREEIKMLHNVLEDHQAKIGNPTYRESEEKCVEILKRFFTEGQIRCILENRKWVRWSVDDYAAAISLRSVSPKAYRYLRNRLNYPLPSFSSLKAWALNKFNVQEGFLTDVLKLMFQKGRDMSFLEKITVITFDEMSVSDDVQFDLKMERIVGPHSKVQVIMVRGLFGKWKQPIFYKFDKAMTKNILIEAISRLHDAGYQVVAVTCDMGNKGVFGELGITPDNHYFHHPNSEVDPVFVFADVPHLLKLLRNWFVDDGLYLQDCKDKFTVDVYQSLVNMSSQGDLKVAFRITQQLLDARHTQRQAVLPAARMWSHSVGKAILWAGDSGLFNFPEYKKFSDFVILVNDWFDVHNSQALFGKHAGTNAFGQNLKYQDSLLQLMTSTIRNMRVGNRKELMPFQKGIIISNSSLRGLYAYMETKCTTFHYIITRRLQQDILENFFSYIRGMGASNDHPSAYDFKYRIRWYVLGKHSHAIFSMNRNTEEDLDVSCMSSSSSVLNSTSSRPSTAQSNKSLTCPSTSSAANVFTSTPRHHNKLEEDHTVERQNVEYDEHEHPEDSIIILTEKLFTDIINISPDELIEDQHTDDIEDSDNTLEVTSDTDLFQFISRTSQETESTCRNTGDFIQEAGLEYVAGYVAYKFQSKYPFLGSQNDIPEDSTQWVNTISKGYLTHPSTDLIQLGKVIEKHFVAFHGKTFSSEDCVIKKVVEMVKGSEQYVEQIPPDVLYHFVKTRTYIRVRELNKNRYITKQSTQKKKKMKKIVSKKK